MITLYNRSGATECEFSSVLVCNVMSTVHELHVYSRVQCEVLSLLYIVFSVECLVYTVYLERHTHTETRSRARVCLPA